MSIKSETISGQCHCGGVSVTAPISAKFTFSCHCEDCRKLSSGGRLLGYGVDKQAVELDGEVSTYAYAGGSGKNIVLNFCPNCSTQILAELTAYPDVAVIRAGILDNVDGFIPDRFMYTHHAFDWDVVQKLDKTADDSL